MAKRKDKEKNLALKLREEGKSYSEIRESVEVSKSTLSLWLRERPLSSDQMKRVRDLSSKRIENYRRTCAKRRDLQLEDAFKNVGKVICSLSEREKFIAGMFLYWGEGLKSGNTQTSIANTDPSMIKFFLNWLYQLHVPKNKIRLRLHLYSDMNAVREEIYWSRELGISRKQFRKPYIKNSQLSDVRHSKGGFGHGTCNVIYGNREFNDFVLQGVKYLQNIVR